MTIRCASGFAPLQTDPDPTPFFGDFKDANIFGSNFFLITYPQDIIFCLYSTVLKINFVLGKDPDPEPDPYL